MNGQNIWLERLVHRRTGVSVSGSRSACRLLNSVTGLLVTVSALLATALVAATPGLASDTKATEMLPVQAVSINKPVLPAVMSTNLCADMLLLGLADASQIVSLSYQAQDSQRSSQATTASSFASNQASAEEVIAAQPDVVLASRRWQAQHQARLFQRFGIKVINVPYPKDWPGIFDSLELVGKAIAREDRARELIVETQRRLQNINKPPEPLSALYLRGNGGTAAAGTFIDALFQSLAVTNQAGEYGATGWARVSLESIVLEPPDAFMLSHTRGDTSLASSGVTRHPLLRELLVSKPVLFLNSLDTGCSDWRQIETVEKLAAELRQQPAELTRAQGRAR